MAIADEARKDGQDLTVEHIERVSKGKRKVATQVEKMYDATDQLKTVAESRTYFVSPAQWDEVIATLRHEVDELEAHIQRMAQRQLRTKGRRFEWSA